MNRWALELKADGKGHAVDAAEACAARRSPAIFVWVHLDGRESDTLKWLQDHGGMPSTVIYALTAMETRPRSEAIDDGALINLRGPSAEEKRAKNGEDTLVSIRVWVEEGRAISVSFHPLKGIDKLVDQMKNGEIKDPGDLISHLAMIITKQVDPVISELDDLVDDCELRLEPEHAFETRRRIAVVGWVVIRMAGRLTRRPRRTASASRPVMPERRWSTTRQAGRTGGGRISSASPLSQTSTR